MKLPSNWTDNGNDYVVYEAPTGVYAAPENRDELLWLHPVVARRIVRLEEDLKRAERIIALAKNEARRHLFHGDYDCAVDHAVTGAEHQAACDILEVLEGE